MKCKFLICLVFCFIFLMHCGEEPPEEGGTPLTNFRKINAITFGTTWNASDSILSDTGRTFPADTRAIYYQVTFDSVLLNWFMVKNVWKRTTGSGTETLLSSVALIPTGAKSVCGEFHYYDTTQAMGSGTYTIFVYYYDSAYIHANYSNNVDTTFVIE